MGRDEGATEDVSAQREVSAFAARNRGVHPVVEAFPSDGLSKLAASVRLPMELAPDLLTLLSVASRYRDGDDYHGADLGRQACVVRALARLTSPPADAAQAVAALLVSVTHDRHHAQPGGSPDIDKYERDQDVEMAEDTLALACAEALARLGPAAHATACKALEPACRHRDKEVRFVARQVLRLLLDEPVPPVS